MDSTTAEPCEELPWDTKFFGVRVARVAGDVLTLSISEAIEEWCAAHRIDCLYFAARPDDALTVTFAEEHGYHLTDVRQMFEKSGMGVPPMSSPQGELKADAQATKPSIRLARPDDVPALRRIARASHTDTRFFYDDRFPRTLCESLYETWIQSSCEGFAQAVFVAEEAGQLGGYVTCHVAKEGGQGSIGLIAVDGSRQGRGLGRQLVAAALDWFAVRQVQRISVVTQGRNLAAQRLYARCGFIPRKLELYYHRWFPMLLTTDKDRR